MYEKRVCILYFSILLCLWMLCTKLYILSTDQNPSLAVLDGQYSGRLDIAERSGFIYDRYFSFLSHDKYTGLLVVNPVSQGNPKEMLRQISQISAVTELSELEEKYFLGIPFSVSVTDDQTAEKLSLMYPQLYYCPTYSENTSTAQHFLGYSKEKEGITGLRRTCSALLYDELYAKNTARFTDNAKNQSLSALTIEDSLYNSKDGIITTLDKSLQSYCDSLESNIKSGCIIVADSSNGEILAMSSFPSYDTQKLSDYMNSDKGELLNRTLYSFTPGSVFKIIVSAAALEKDISYFSFAHDCQGSIQVGNSTFRCHKAQGHGVLTMKDAFAQSCNCYYASLAEKIGLDTIIEFSEQIEINSAISADFLSEANHSFIDNSNKSAGFLANISIGQGSLCLSPLDMINVMICTCTGSKTPLTTILGKVENGKAVYLKEKAKKEVISDETVNLLCLMMEECVNTGTGKSAKIEGVRMGGKTATAQTGRFDSQGVEYVHKWFCGFYDGIEKRYVFTILCDNTTENNLSPAVVSGLLCSFLKENGY